MALKVGELYASFGIDSSGLNSALSGIEKKCSSIAKGLTITGAAMTATITRSVVNAGKDVYETGTKFHAQMSKVGAIANADADDMERLSQKALEMGSTTSFTATEAGEAMQYMAMAGWKTEDMLDGIASIMDLAAASGESLGTTSDIVTDALTAMGLSAKDSQHFAEVMAATATNSNTNVGMMGESFKYVAPLAGTLGYSIDDLAVALGVMANSGIKSSQAGTSLARILNNMIKPTDKQAAAMDDLGLSLYDSEGNSKSLMQVMEDMRAAAKDNGVDMESVADSVAQLDAQLESGEISEREYMDQMTKVTGVSQDFMASVAELAGTRGLSGMLAIMNASDDDFNQLAEAIAHADGSLDKMVATMLDNAQGDVILFNSALDGLKITLWDLAEGPFRSIVQNGTKALQTIQGLDSGTQIAALKTVGLAAAAGPALTAMGGLVGAAGKLIPFLGALAGPVGILGAGLGLFAVAAVDADNSIGGMFETVAKKSKWSMMKLSGKIHKGINDVNERMPKLIGSVTNGLNDLLPSIMNTGGVIANGLLKTVSKNAKGFANVGKTVITNVAGGISRFAPSVIPNAVNAVTSVATSVIDNLPMYVGAIGDVAMSLVEGLRNVNWSEVGTNLLTSIVNAASGIGAEFSRLFNKAKTMLLETDWSDVSEKIAGFFTGAGDIIKKAVLGDDFTDESTWGDVGSAIRTAITEAFSGSGEGAGSAIKQLILGDNYAEDSTWADVGGAILAAIKNGVSKTGDFIKGLILGDNYAADATWAIVGTSILTAIKNGVSKTGSFIKELILGENYSENSTWSEVGSNVLAAIKNGIKGTGSFLKELILGENYSEDSTWSDVGTIVLTAIKNGMKGTGSFLKELILGEGYSEDSTWSDVGTIVLTAIKNGIKGKSNALKELILGEDYSEDSTWSDVGSKVLTAIKNGVKGTGSALKELLLGEKYDANSTWSDVGRQIMTALKSGFAEGTDLLKQFVLGDNYTPDASWATVGKSIWEKIKEGLGSAKEKLSEFILGDDYNPDDSAEVVGQKIMEKVQSGLEEVTNLKEAAFNVAENIIGWISEKLGTIGQEGGISFGDMSGVATNLLDSIISAKVDMVGKGTELMTTLVSGLADFNWENVGTFVGNIASGLIGAIANGVHDLAGSGVKIMEAVGDVVGGENGNSFVDAATGIAQDIVTGIGTALPGLVDDASSLVTGMGELIGKLPWETMGADLGSLATSVVDTLKASITTISDQGGFSGLIDSLGQGMVAAADGLSATVGAIVGKIAGYFMNPGNLISLAEAGGKLLWEIVKGMGTSVYHLSEAAATIVSNLLVGATRGIFGIEVDPVVEAKQIEFGDLIFETENYGAKSGRAFVEAMESEMYSAEGIDKAIEGWAIMTESGYAEYFPEFKHLGNEALMNFTKGVVGGEGTQEDMAFLYASGLFGNLVDQIENGAGGNEAAQALAYAMEDSLDEAGKLLDLTGVVNQFDTMELFGATIPEGIGIGIKNGRMVLFDELGNVFDEAAETIINGYDLSDLSDFLGGAWNTAIESSFGHIENLNVKWDLIDAFKGMGFSASDIMNFDFADELVAQIVADLEAGKITIDEAIAGLFDGQYYSTDGDVTVDVSDVNVTAEGEATVDLPVTPTVNQETLDTITQEAEAKSSALAAAISSMPETVQADVASAMTSLVTTIAENESAVQVACSAVVSAAANTLTSDAGITIGSDFVSGISQGIANGMATAAASARLVANAVIREFRVLWDEHSPSKLAKKDLAFNFTKGLAQGFTGGVKLVTKAAGTVGQEATDRLNNSLAKQAAYWDQHPPVNLSGALKKTAKKINDQTNLKTTKSTVNSRGGSGNDSAGNASGGSGDGETGCIFREIGVDGLMSKLDALIEAAQNGQQIVMDNGVLVGQVARGVDRELGMRSQWRGGGRT